MPTDNPSDNPSNSPTNPTNIPTNIPSFSPTCDYESQEAKEITFVIDESSSIGNSQFKNIKNYIKNWINNRNNHINTKFSIITFGTDINVKYRLHETQYNINTDSWNNIINSINSIHFNGGWSHARQGIEKAIKLIELDGNNLIEYKNKWIVVITDGNPSGYFRYKSNNGKDITCYQCDQSINYYDPCGTYSNINNWNGSIIALQLPGNNLFDCFNEVVTVNNFQTETFDNDEYLYNRVTFTLRFVHNFCGNFQVSASIYTFCCENYNYLLIYSHKYFTAITMDEKTKKR